MRSFGTSFGLPLAAVLAFASAAKAQTATPADTQTIVRCLKAATDADEFGGACIGQIADPCIKAAKVKNSYWEESQTCAARELTVWNALLASTLPKLKSQKFVPAAQKAWADSLKGLCPAFDKLDPGTSLGGANYCRL